MTEKEVHTANTGFALQVDVSDEQLKTVKGTE